MRQNKKNKMTPFSPLHQDEEGKSHVKKQETINYFSPCSIAHLILMTEKIPQHMHCQICGKAIQASDSETMCSDECKQRYQALTKRRKLWVYIMYVLIFVMIGVLLLSNYIRI